MGADIRFGDEILSAAIAGDRVQIADRSFTVAAIGRGLYRVSDGERHWTVAVAGPNEDRWIFVGGQVVCVQVGQVPRSPAVRRTPTHELGSPMPATVVRVLVTEGVRVGRGDTLILLEAMKMELPIRAPRDGVVRAVHCKPGELVQPGVNLLEFE